MPMIYKCDVCGAMANAEERSRLPYGWIRGSYSYYTPELTYPRMDNRHLDSTRGRSYTFKYVICPKCEPPKVPVPPQFECLPQCERCIHEFDDDCAGRAIECLFQLNPHLTK